MREKLVFTKLVDKSTLYEGISIPVACQETFYRMMGISLKKGEQKDIYVEIGGLIYEDAVVRNQAFDEEKYPDRADIVQIRYSSRSLLAQRIREIFHETDGFVNEQLKQKTNRNKLIEIPEDRQESIDLYVYENGIRFDCHPCDTQPDYVNETDYGEEVPSRRNVSGTSFKRNAHVIDKAKKRAAGICQLCGRPAPFHDKQGKPYLEVHHILWLSRGGADKVSNVVALCPNCHTKMHVVDDENDIAQLLEKAKID